MITVKGKVFSIEPEDISVEAIIEGEATQTMVKGTGVQVIAASGSTIKFGVRKHVDEIRKLVAVGDSVSITVAKD